MAEPLSPADLAAIKQHAEAALGDLNVLSGLLIGADLDFTIGDDAKDPQEAAMVIVDLLAHIDALAAENARLNTTHAYIRERGRSGCGCIFKHAEPYFEDDIESWC